MARNGVDCTAKVAVWRASAAELLHAMLACMAMVVTGGCDMG